jgi:RNA-directed DNA polymerase
MRVKWQQGGADQGDLLDEALRAALRHDANREGSTGPKAPEEPQARTAWDQERALTQHLMEVVSGAANLNRAYKRVKANGGAPGVDGMTVEALRDWIATNRERLIASLLDGSYQPQPVRGVSIPKPGGGERQFGQSRHSDGPSGTAHWRQAPAAHCPPLPASGDDGERGVRRTA